MSKLAVFGYGSLVDAPSAARTLGRDPAESRPEGTAWTAELVGWQRRWSQARDNRRCEKTFALDRDGSVPDYVLGLNIERTGSPHDVVNGLLIAVSEEELARLDLREVRYDRVDVTAEIAPHSLAAEFEAVITYEAKPENLVLEPPAGSVILRSYAEAVEAAFAKLGPGQRLEYLRTTQTHPVEPVDAHLISDRIPEGNPRAW